MSAGFLNPRGAQTVLRRLMLRRSLMQAQRLISALLDSLDQGDQQLRRPLPMGSEATAELGESDIACRAGHDRIDHVEGDHASEEQLLQGADLILQFLNSLLKAMGHGRFSFRPFR